jgi:hypothetical protein
MARFGFSHSRRDAGLLTWCQEVAAAVRALGPAMSARSDAELRLLADSYRA